MERRLDALKNRVDADEARLSAVEKAQNSGSSPDSDVIAALKSATAKNSAELAALHQQLSDLPYAEGPANGTGRPSPSGTYRASALTIARLSATLAKTQGKLAHLSGALHSIDEELALLQTHVAALEKHAPPADLQQQLESFAPKSAVAQLGQRLTRVERDTPAQVLTKAAAMLALAELVEISARGAPYDHALHVLTTLLPQSPALNVLSRHARQGAPSVGQLAQSLDQNANTILEAERLAYAPNWFARTWAELGNLVSVRRIAPVSGNTTQAHLARAQQALAHGDVATAVANVAGLDRPARAAASSWLTAARARLAIDAATRSLSTMILSQSTQKSAPNSTGAR